jgi:ferredoxin-thioredoxin reductase catalytic subunit
MTDGGIDAIRDRITVYATKNGYRLNPDERQRDAVIRGIARNQERFGAGYCPCRVRSGDPERDQAII